MGEIVDTAAAPAATRTLLDAFATTVAQAGPSVAIDAPDAVLTYDELAGAVSELGWRLRALGAGPGDRVGVRVTGGTAELYVAILGVLVSGAAYVPVDADDPPARADAIWREAGACAVVTDGLIITELSPGAGGDHDLTADDDAWIIFTSGSTGTPKGVAITHRAAVAFVEAEARLWTVEPGDRVLAGLSVAFDASCEEMWLAWRHGAALVPAPGALMRAGPDLGPWLAARGVTVVSTVPTLAAIWDTATLAGVRLLILGGEACPAELGWRLAEGREVWNTYGPTEATVVSTAAPVRPGEPITIGRPLEGWHVAIVDTAGQAVTFGEAGELVIGGIGLGRYLDPALDADRFRPVAALGPRRAYRTGDIVRETLAGIEFVGRRDNQVKLGGRRIELGEIEAALTAAPGVRAAAAAVQGSAGGSPVLVGYVVGDIDVARVRTSVATRLPGGIGPLIVALDALPAQASGKIDRAALPWPPPSPNGGRQAELTSTAAWLAERWAEQLGPQAIRADSDFFALGGTSLAAAKLVSRVRSRFPAVAVADVYAHRRLGELAARLDEIDARHEAAPAATARPRRHWGAAQVAGVVLLLAVTAPLWLEAILVYDQWLGTGARIGWPAIVAGWLIFISAPGRALLVVAARRMLLRRLAPGRYPRRGWLACRVWFVDRLAELLHLNHLGGTPWATRLARLAGAEVGAGARLGTLPSPTALIRIGPGATFEAGVDAHGWWIDGDEMVIDELRIGAGARVGARTVLMPGADIGAGAEVEPGSVVSTPVPAGERWAGSPARPVGRAGADWPAGDPPAERWRWFWHAMYGAGLTGVSAVTLLAAVPSVVVFAALGGTVAAVLLGAPLLDATFVIGYAVLTALLFRVVSRFVRPGWHSDQGATAWALWFSEQLMDAARTVLFPLYATIYTRAWLRLHGLAVGRRTEVSTAEGLNRLVRLGQTSFVADAPMFAVGRAHRGWLHVEPIEVGDRTFVGNGALLTGGTRLGNDSLVGIESSTPLRSADGTSWFGCPPIELPRVPEPTDPARTTSPSRRLVLARGATEIVRILLPGSASILLGTGVFLTLDRIAGAWGAAAMIALSPTVIAVASVAAVALTVAAKWVLIGRYRPGEYPLWSSFVWRDEIINSCQEQLAGDWLLNKALGTPLMAPYLRAMGARVGRDVWCETLAITEFDVVTIGDGCAVNRGACLETHLFHDRVMRVGPTDLGARSTLGPVSAILPETRLGAGCCVGGRSVVMRGEVLPAGTRWHGAPVVAM